MESFVSLSDLENTFKNATFHLQTLASSLSPEQLLIFYGFYKQATCGPCNEPQPNWFQVKARQKWQAWKKVSNMNTEQAMINYIQTIENLDPTWKTNIVDKPTGWIIVSTMPNMDEELKDADKKLLDWVKEGNQEKVQEYLTCDTSEIHLKDENGMSPLHWAADRGNAVVLQSLIKAGADVNAIDLEGQTPLHYAASCGHEGVVKYLLSQNAALLEDHCGLTPKHVADENLLSMF